MMTWKYYLQQKVMLICCVLRYLGIGESRQACVTHYIWVNRIRNHPYVTRYRFFHTQRDSTVWFVFVHICVVVWFLPQKMRNVGWKNTKINWILSLIMRKHYPLISRVQSRRFTVDSADASALDSGTNLWVRWSVRKWIVGESPKRLLSRFNSLNRASVKYLTCWLHKINLF
jgi:hypothetical protein